MNETDYLKKEIEKIKVRNKKVEADKSWEISRTRKISITIITYILISIFLKIINVEKPLLSAIVPSLAYILSGLSINLIKNLWLNNQNRQ